MKKTVLRGMAFLSLHVASIYAHSDRSCCAADHASTVQPLSDALQQSFSKAQIASEDPQRVLPEGVILFPIDRVVVVIDGPERRHVICESELQRIGIDGRRPTVNDLIVEELIYQDALKHKIPIEDYADRYIRSIKKHHNIGDAEVNVIFAQAGLSPEEGRDKLQKMGANTTMLDFKVKSRIFIPQQEVEEYFNQNPMYKDARYFLEVAFVPYFAKDPEQQRAYLLEQVEQGAPELMWGQPFWIKQNEIAEDKSFIYAMNIGEVSKPQRVEGGYELYRIKAKKERKLISLQKRYRDIVDTLREPSFKKMFDTYIKELIDNASIDYL